VAEKEGIVLVGFDARTCLILFFTGWLSYTCFKRAIKPPKDRISRWYKEVEAVNRNPIVRAMNILFGVLVLLIGINAVFSR
jgi:hypothetical protein